MKDSLSILELPCDVLIPAALEAQIHSGNAARVQVSVYSTCHRILNQTSSTTSSCIASVDNRSSIDNSSSPSVLCDEGVLCLVQARVVAEAANGPVTPPAEQILEEKGVVILPDLLLNAVRMVFARLAVMDVTRWKCARRCALHFDVKLSKQCLEFHDFPFRVVLLYRTLSG